MRDPVIMMRESPIAITARPIFPLDFDTRTDSVAPNAFLQNSMALAASLTQKYGHRRFFAGQVVGWSMSHESKLLQMGDLRGRAQTSGRAVRRRGSAPALVTISDWRGDDHGGTRARRR